MSLTDDSAMALMTSRWTLLDRLIQGLGTTRNVEERLDVLHDVLQGLGWRQFVYGWSNGRFDGSITSIPLLVRAFPANWDRQWHRHSLSDPYFLKASTSMWPVKWSDVHDEHEHLTIAQRDCIQYVADLGLTDGLTVPIHVKGRRFAFLTAIGFTPDPPDWSREDAATLLMLVAHYFDNYMWSNTAPDQIVISPRERECLYWSACGKTIEDIATILAISTETVRVYLKRINQKLASANRTHAVAKALYMGLISLN